MNSDLHESFLHLVRLGIGSSKDSSISNDIDWDAIKALADKQGLLAVVIDGIEHLPETQRPHKDLLLQWIGEVMQNYEHRYKSYELAISSLANFYNAHCFKMMILKGYACSLDWPKPEHRPCGDIDIWVFGQQESADKALGSWFKVQGSRIRIDTSHHHHTVFDWQGFTVENHYDFVNVHHSKSNAQLESVFKELGADDSYPVEVDEQKVYLPSPNLHALFLLRHAMIEFAAGGINLRQLLDWAFFVEKNGKDVDWDWLLGVLDEFHMRKFFNCINAICVEDLGYDATIFPYVQYLPELKERVLADILSPEFTAQEPKRLLLRVVYKYRRWNANGWKHTLCYKESRWSAFGTGVWNHILKPASI